VQFCAVGLPRVWWWAAVLVISGRVLIVLLLLSLLTGQARHTKRKSSGKKGGVCTNQTHRVALCRVCGLDDLFANRSHRSVRFACNCDFSLEKSQAQGANAFRIRCMRSPEK
jgi:hypothetical protein